MFIFLKFVLFLCLELCIKVWFSSLKVNELLVHCFKLLGQSVGRLSLNFFTGYMKPK